MKTETKHTPGPWKIEQYSGDIYAIGPIRAGGMTESWLEIDGDTVTTAANAKLIAAAPELLAALKHITQDERLRQVDFDICIAAVKKAIE